MTAPVHTPSAPPLFFVINGGSGREDLNATRSAIDVAMKAAGRVYEVSVLDRKGGVESTIRKAVKAASSRAGVVVAVGGDGTINAVASAALEAGCLFGAVPRGTFNYFGRTHGIPEDIEEALDGLLLGAPVPVQVGWVNDRVFLVNASVGLYPELLEDREQFKQRYGRSRLVALWSAIITAFGEHRHFDMVLEQDGRPVHLRATTLFVGNNRLQLEQVGMPQAELLSRHTLAAIAVNPVSTFALLGLAARGAIGRLADADHVSGFSFRSLTVTPLGLWRGLNKAWQDPTPKARRSFGRRGIKVAIDGEIIWLHGPLHFKVGEEPLMLMKPEQEASAERTGDGNQTPSAVDPDRVDLGQAAVTVL